jgi:hypothetical protein
MVIVRGRNECGTTLHALVAVVGDAVVVLVDVPAAAIA